MVGAASLNSTQLAVDSVLGQVNTTTVPEPEKPSLSAPNEEEVPERINKTEGNGAAGVKKAEAAALVWSKNALWAIYAWIWVCFFMLAFYSSIGTNVLVNAYANFKTAPEISTAAILATVVGGVVKLPIAKIVNIWASKSGICLAFSSTPFIYTAFTGPLAAQSFLNMTTWRWAYSAFTIVFPVVLLSLAITFKLCELKAKKLGFYKLNGSNCTWTQSI